MGIVLGGSNKGQNLFTPVIGDLPGGAGALSLTKTGNGVWVIAGNNTYSGGTTIATADANQYSALQVGAGGNTGSLSSGAVSVAAGASLVFARSDSALTMAQVISGAGTVVEDGPGNTTLSAINTYTGGTVVSAGTLTVANGGQNGGINGTLQVDPGATINLTAANALGYTPGTFVNKANIYGLLNHTGAGDQGWGITYALAGGTLQSNGGTSQANASQHFSFGNSTVVGTVPSGTPSLISGAINVRDNTTVFNVPRGSAAADLVITAAMYPQAAGGFTKNGLGIMSLTSNANTYNGTATINGGTLLEDFSAAGARPATS